MTNQIFPLRRCSRRFSINKSNTVCFQWRSVTAALCHLLSSGVPENYHFAAVSTHRKKTSAISTCQHQAQIFLPTFLHFFYLLPNFLLCLSTWPFIFFHYHHSFFYLIISHYSHLPLSGHLSSCSYSSTLSYSGLFPVWDSILVFSHYFTGLAAERTVMLCFR